MFKQIKEKIRGKSLILFGELHGTKEIPKFIEKFFSELAKEEEFNICFEIPREFQENIEEFFKISKKEESDGRNSLEYLNLIKKLNSLDRNIDIFCIDPEGETQIEREEGLAKNILKHVNEKKTFVILGDVHASKNKLSIGGTKINPMGAILSEKLKEKMFSIRIVPSRGKFFNFGVKEIKEGSEKDVFNDNFDYIYNVGKVSECSFLNK